MLIVFMQYTPAHAAANKHVVWKRDSWSMIRTWAAPNLYNAGTHVESVTDTINTNYIFWPDGDGVNKIAIGSVQVCYNLNGGDGILFQGVNGNPDYVDDNDHVIVGSIAVDDDNTNSNCKTYTIPSEFRRWFRMDQDPAWAATGKVRLMYTPDDDFTFEWGGLHVKFFHPGDDPETSDWFYCECAYGGAGH